MYLQNKLRKIIKQTFSLMTFSENGIAAYLYFTRSYYDVIVTWRHSECCLYIYTDVTIDCLKLWMTIRESVASLSVWLKMTRFHFSNRLTKKLKKPSSKKGSKVPSNVPSTSAEAGGTEEVMSNMVLKTVDSDTKKSCSSSSSCSSFDVASDITRGSVERIFQVKSFNILSIIHYIYTEKNSIPWNIACPFPTNSNGPPVQYNNACIYFIIFRKWMATLASQTPSNTKMPWRRSAKRSWTRS